MDSSKVRRVNFAFFQLDEEDNIWGTDEWAGVRESFFYPPVVVVASPAHACACGDAMFGGGSISSISGSFVRMVCVTQWSTREAP